MNISYFIDTRTNLFSINHELADLTSDKVSFLPEDKKSSNNNNILLKGFVSSTVPTVLKSERFFYVNKEKQTKIIHSMFGSPLTWEIVRLSKAKPVIDATNLPPNLYKTVLTTAKTFGLYMKGDMAYLALDSGSKVVENGKFKIPVRSTTNEKNAVSLFATHFIPSGKVSTVDHGERIVIYTKYVYDVYKEAFLILTTTDSGELQFRSEANFNSSVFRFIKYNSMYNPLLEEYHIHDVNQFMQTKNKLSPPFTFSGFKLEDDVLIESFMYSFLGFESFLFTFSLSSFNFSSIRKLEKNRNRIVHFRSRIYLESMRIKNPLFYTKISKLILVLNQVSVVREFPLLFNNPDHGMIVQKFCDLISFKYLQRTEKVLFDFVNKSPSMNDLILWTETNLVEIYTILDILASFESSSIRPVSILNSIYELLENQTDTNKKKVFEDLFRELSSGFVTELIFLMKNGYCKLSYDYIQKQMDNISRYSILFWDVYCPLEIDKFPKCLVSQYDDILNVTKYNTIFNTSNTLIKDATNMTLKKKLEDYKYSSMGQFKAFVVSLAGVLRNSFKSFCSYNDYLEKGIPYFHNCSSLYNGNVLDSFFVNCKEYLMKDIKKLYNKEYRLKLESIMTKEYKKCVGKYLTDYMKDEFNHIIKFNMKIATSTNKHVYEIMSIQCKVLWPFSALVGGQLVNAYSTLSNKLVQIKFRLFLLNCQQFKEKRESCLAFALRGLMLGVIEFYYTAVNNTVFYNHFNKLLHDEKWEDSVLRLDYLGASIYKKSFMETKFFKKGLSGVYYITDKLIEFKTNEDVEEIPFASFVRETVKIKEYFNGTISKLMDKSNVQNELKFLTSSISL